MKTEFLVGIVESIIDPTKSFKIYTKIIDEDKRVNVVYTSPFFFKGVGGTIAVPNIGSRILILHNIDRDVYYYMSTIVDKFDSTLDPGDISDPMDLIKNITQEQCYTDKDIPQRITFVNEQNAGLVVKDERLQGYITSEVRLQSDQGKVLALQDSPKDNKVVIRNEHGDGIRITSDSLGGVFYDEEYHDLFGSRGIYSLCDGDQQMVSYTGGMKLMVVDGREIDIVNYSTGSNGFPTSSLNTGTTGAARRIGNVNISSKDSDVNIRAGQDVSSIESAIYITTPYARIQINPSGSIDISSTGDLNIKSDGHLSLQSGKDIKLKCVNFRVQTSEKVDMSAGGTFLAKASANAEVNGAQVHFNSNNVTSMGTISDIQQPKLNAYED
ncbi:MAG: hypothetical protein RL348_836 [Bacteroidota bacterium]|jgi:hypothetical protein